jgi:hypothetical protein
MRELFGIQLGAEAEPGGICRVSASNFVLKNTDYFAKV